MRYKNRKSAKFQKEHIIYGLIILLLVVYGVMLYSTIDIFSTLSQKTKENYEATRGSNFDLIEIVNNNCADCYDISNVHAALVQQGAVIESRKIVKHDTEEGKSLIEEYGITKLPSVVITGELNRTHSSNVLIKTIGIEKSGAVVLSIFTPYYELSTGKTRGLVSVTYLTDVSCKDCYNVTLHKDILQGYGVKIINERSVDVSSAEGKNIATKYNITYVPTIVIDSEMQYYEELQQAWSGVGKIASDGSYIFTNTEFMNQLGGNYTTVKVG